MQTLRFLAAEHRRCPWVLPGVLVTGSAAFGSALPDIIAAIARVLS